MDGERREYRSWSHFLTGVFIGLMVVMPALAMPPDLPVAFNDDTRLYVLIGSGVLLLIALVLRLMRNRGGADIVDGEAIDGSRGRGMRFFPTDRPIPIE